MFDLVADIERYPEFVPGYVFAKVRRREDDTLYVDQTVRIGGMSQEFSSVASTVRPERISIRSAHRAFRYLQIDWYFMPVAGNGCLVKFRVEYEFRLRFFEALFGRWMNNMANAIMTSFQRRADTHLTRGGEQGRP